MAAGFAGRPDRRIRMARAVDGNSERAEHNDEGRAREWIARALNAAADPTWTAEGHTSDRWLPVSPGGRIDAFEWRVPLKGIVSAPAIEAEPARAAPIEIAEPAPTYAEPPPAVAEALPHRRSGEQQKDKPDSLAAPKAEPIIPLVHAPDDPGPEAVEEDEEPAEPDSGGSWRRILG